MMSTEFMKEFRHGIHELHNTHSTTRTTRTFKHSIPITPPQESWAIVFFSEFVGSQSSQRRSPIWITHHQYIRKFFNRLHANMKTVVPWRNQRSTNQNNYYFGVVLAVISAHTGHSPQELHEIFKR